ncbi:hypothetical protein AMJ86_03895 [bacterium SM23_57]|nr:MAG: hypothetical protein AMJ86_03895 [bacterium SM23_57]
MPWHCVAGFFTLVALFLIVGYLGDRIVKRNGTISATLDRIQFGIFLIIIFSAVLMILMAIIWVIVRVCAS